MDSKTNLNSLMQERDILISQFAFLQQLLTQWQEAETQSFPVSIFIIEVDNFSSIENKSSCFDQVLSTVHGLFHRETDFLTRFNRKQILVISAHMSFRQTNQLANKIHKAVDALKIFHPYSPNGRYVTVSIGHTTYSPEPDDYYGVLDILATVIKHVREAQKSGGNCSKTRLHSKVLK